jgi:hypothetical protein
MIVYFLPPLAKRRRVRKHPNVASTEVLTAHMSLGPVPRLAPRPSSDSDAKRAIDSILARI